MRLASCRICGKAFVPSRTSHANLYCSHECYYEARRRGFYPREKQGIVKTCPICKKEFYVFKSQINRRETCSRRCKNIRQMIKHARKRKLRFEKDITKNKYRRRDMRRWLKELGGEQCELCGWDEAPVDICHIIPRKEGGETILSNVVFLCPNHHRMYDSGLIQREHLAALAQKRQLDTTPLVQYFQ